MRSVLALKIPGSRIILANPCKGPETLIYARKVGVNTTVFDNIEELERIHQFMPRAKLLLRIYASDETALIDFGLKFGALASDTKGLLERAKELGMSVVGVSFHVGEFPPLSLLSYSLA